MVCVIIFANELVLLLNCALESFKKETKKCIRRVPESECLAKLVLTVAWILVDKENLLPHHLSTHYQLSIVDKDFDQSTNC